MDAVVSFWKTLNQHVRRGPFLVVLLLLAHLPPPLVAQHIPKEEYIDYLPLENLRIKRQAEATAAFALYGDTNDPTYRDVARLDGIDDRRHTLLMDLAVHFAPYMVQNTTALPMDHQKFWGQGASFPLYVDTWDVSMEKPEIVATDAIDLVEIAATPCPESTRTEDTGDDCRLLALLDAFHPDRPTNERFQTAAVAPDRDLLGMMYFDYPGRTPQDWRERYQDPLSKQLPRQFHDFVKAYVHPFIHTVRSANDGVRGYEFVLHYWFFYPFNDGGNNHVGDWEHINVVISPLSRIGQPLGEPDIRRLLDAGVSSPLDDPLVISRVEYYFHHQVITLDYSHPNVYLPKETWEAQKKQRVEERFGEAWLWNRIRHLAYNDDAETVINTHPVVYIGADNKGLDQLLNLPGGVSRDPHGNYPFPGLYKGGGPAIAAEEIASYFDHRAYYRKQASEPPSGDPLYKRGNVVPFDDPGRLKMVPDWERVIDLIHSNPEARREWSWLVLPIRWGFPAVKSPGAGFIKHADTGNTAPPGPAYIPGWNIVGPSIYSETYDPHVLPAIFPQQWQDNFINSGGVLNLTLPTLASLPPFDIAWRVVSSPFQLFSEKSTPIFYPTTRIPFRFVGVSPGVSFQRIPDDFIDLSFVHEPQFAAFIERIVEHVADNGLEAESPTFSNSSDDNTSALAQVSFYLGGRFVSENTLRHARHTLRTDGSYSVPFTFRSELNLWEYAGSIRYNLSAGGFRPSLIAGYGLSWYRVEQGSTNGTPLAVSTTPWVRRPSLGKLKHLLPNTFHVGVGVEFIAIKSFGGLDVSVSADYRAYTHKLGVDLRDAPLARFLELGIEPSEILAGGRVWRHTVNALFTISF